MVENLTQMMVRSGPEWILWLLFALSVLSLAIGLERWWVLRKARGNVSHLVATLRSHLRSNDLAGAHALLNKERGIEARVAAAGLADADAGFDAAEEAMAASIGLERARLQRRLLFLGTVGNNAPFIGLLGTVIGVVGAFDALGAQDAISGAMASASALAPERVMTAIAEALVATAVGLLVAIPAVAAYNYFQNRVTTVIAGAETLGHVVLSFLKSPSGDSAAGE